MTQEKNNQQWPPGSSKTAQLIRDTDWSKTVLGPTSQWPACLKIAINMVLESNFPMYVWWGKDQINIYNDNYALIAGPQKHPRFFGAPAKLMWPEIWPTMNELLQGVLTEGKNFLFEDLPLKVERSEKPEEATFTFTYGPVRDESGIIQGVQCTVFETTAKVLAEKRHLSSVNELQNFFLQSPVPMVILLGPEHRFTLVNPQYEKLTGKKELMGKKISEAFQQENIGPFIDILDNVYSTGVPFIGREVFFSFVSDDGISHDSWLDFGYHPYRDENNQIQGILAIVTDMTAQVVARKAMEESQQELQQLADRMPQIVWTANPDGELNYFNDVWFKYSNSDYETNVGTGWAQFVHPDDIAHTAENWSQSIVNETQYTNEFRLRRYDGAYRWHIARAYPVRDVNNKVIKWIGTNTDIHEVKTYTYSLNSEKIKFESLFADASTSMALLTGKELIFENVNPSYHKLFNDRIRIGKPIIEVLPELKNQPYLGLLQSVYKTGKSYRDDEAQAFLRRTDTSPLEERFFSQTYTQVKDANGYPYGVFIHAVEVTNEVNIRRRLDLAVKTRDDFMSMASHELKTPLTSMRLQTQTLLRSINRGIVGALSPERVTKVFTNNDRQITRLIRLVDDMLDISRIESGKLSMNMSQLDLKEILNEVYLQLKEQFENVGCDTRIELMSGAIGNFDRSRIEQLITNLFTNAMRYGKGQPVEIALLVQGNKATIKVRDHGIGIAPENFEKIFQRFERIISPSEVSGLGIGLFITREIVNSHKGTIWVESELNQGSTFYVELPIN